MAFLAAEQTPRCRALLYLTACFVAASTLPASGHFDGVVQLLEESTLLAKMLIKSSVLNKRPQRVTLLGNGLAAGCHCP